MMAREYLRRILDEAEDLYAQGEDDLKGFKATLAGILGELQDLTHELEDMKLDRPDP